MAEIYLQHSRQVRRGFTLFETIVAMFVLLVGLMGILAVFGSGINARLVAQEMVVSQDLANMWADWIRFRLNESAAIGGPLGVLHLSDLGQGKQGDFYACSGDFHFGGGDKRDPPTYQKNVYKGYRWRIETSSQVKPKYLLPDNNTRDWDKRSDGRALPPGMDAPQKLPVEVELLIVRGARSYRYNYVFSGVGLEYD